MLRRRAPDAGAPPRLLRTLVGVLLPPSLRGCVLGDLAETYVRDRATRGRLVALWRYARETRYAVRLRREARRLHYRQLPAARNQRPALMHHLASDLRYGIRILAKAPGLTVLAVSAIGLGIGLPATMFSIVNGALRDLPFDDADRLMAVSRTSPERGWNRVGVPLSDYTDWREQQTTFEGIALETTSNVNVSSPGERPERISGAVMSVNAFDLLRVQPIIGRGFTASDAAPNAPPVAIVGHSVWVARFDRSPDVLGSTIRANGELVTVVGVMPEDFRFPTEHDLWMPLKANPVDTPRGTGARYRAFGRLNPEVTVAEAQADLEAIASRLSLEYPETNRDIHALVEPYTERFIGGEIAATLKVMLAAVSFVLLIACANVTNLLLAKAAQRTREVAVRTALGATRLQVVTQLLVEAFLLAVAGGILGLAIAHGGVAFFNYASAEMEKVFWIDIKIDGAAMAFVLVLVMLATIAAGIAPALQASGTDANDVLKDESRGASSFRLGRLSGFLVVGEVGLSCALLVAAGLMIKGIVKLHTMDYGFAPEEIFIGEIELMPSDYPDAAGRVQFFEELEQRLAAIPGVTTAALTSTLPARGNWSARVGLEGQTSERAEDYPMTQYAQVSPAFFDVVRARVLQGRGFTPRDRIGATPVAVVNQRFAERFFPGENPLGRRIRRGGPDSPQPWRTIVGVVSNAYITAIDEGDNPDGVYLPLAQGAFAFTNIVLRTQGDPLAITPEVYDVVESMDPNLPVAEINTLAGDILLEKRVGDVFARLFLAFGAAALFLASVGLYGVMSFAVSRRTKELGVRMALGAHTADVLRLVLRQGVWQLAIGLGLGLVLAAVLSRAMAMALFQVDPWDKTIFASIAVLLASTGMLATIIPARRATRVDPMVALRYE